MSDLPDLEISKLPSIDAVNKDTDYLVISKESVAFASGYGSFKVTPNQLMQAVSTTNLSDLGDVNISSPENEQVLKYNGSSWVNSDDEKGTEVEANPSETATDTLTSIKIDNDVYSIKGGGSNVVANPTGTATDTLNKLQVDETIYRIEGGGGSADHITLTQAEYDALVEAGTVDPDAFYFIKDTNGDGQNFQPIIYSLEEREVGVWTDGKPLYEKTFNNITYGSQTTIDVSSLSIDTVVAFGGTSKETSNNNQSTFGYYNNGSDRTQYYYDASNDEIIIAPTSSAHGTVTIRYTKTTDQAGSGTWTPQGVPAVHYSTNEQVVGTWVDGSTVYEKTIYNAGGVTGNFNFPHGITNFGKLLSYEGTVSDSSFAQYGDIWVVPRIASDGNSIGIDKVSTTSIFIINPNAFGTRLIDWYITIRYTKTST